MPFQRVRVRVKSIERRKRRSHWFGNIIKVPYGPINSDQPTEIPQRHARNLCSQPPPGERVLFVSCIVYLTIAANEKKKIFFKSVYITNYVSNFFSFVLNIFLTIVVGLNSVLSNSLCLLVEIPTFFRSSF